MTLFNKKRHYSDVMAFFIENTEGVLINKMLVATLLIIRNWSSALQLCYLII